MINDQFLSQVNNPTEHELNAMEVRILKFENS